MIDNQTSDLVSKSMPAIDLPSLDDDAIKSLIAEGYKELDKRKRQRIKDAKDEINNLAASVGIKVSYREPSTRRKRTSSIDSN